jgi:hypothetical protein
MAFDRKRESWLADVRAHLAMASVSNSALMHQSGKGRVIKSQMFLLDEMQLSGLTTMGEREFYRFLDDKTDVLSGQLLREDDGQPNWGAARKIINIFLRLCAMNKDLNPAYGLSSLEPFLEVPLDNHIVSKIVESKGAEFKSPFQIKTLTRELSSAIQLEAKGIAERKGLFRYELDVIYWNSKKISRQAA